MKEHIQTKSFPSGSAVKQSPCNAGAAGDMGSIPGSGGSPGAGHDNKLQYSRLENPRDRGAWQTTVHGDAEPDTTRMHTKKRLEMKGIRKPKSSMRKILPLGLKAEHYFWNRTVIKHLISVNVMKLLSLIYFTVFFDSPWWTRREGHRWPKQNKL